MRAWVTRLSAVSLPIHLIKGCSEDPRSKRKASRNVTHGADDTVSTQILHPGQSREGSDVIKSPSVKRVFRKGRSAYYANRREDKAVRHGLAFLGGSNTVN